MDEYVCHLTSTQIESAAPARDWAGAFSRDKLRFATLPPFAPWWTDPDIQAMEPRRSMPSRLRQNARTRHRYRSDPEYRKRRLAARRRFYRRKLAREREKHGQES